MDRITPDNCTGAPQDGPVLFHQFFIESSEHVCSPPLHYAFNTFPEATALIPFEIMTYGTAYHQGEVPLPTPPASDAVPASLNHAQLTPYGTSSYPNELQTTGTAAALNALNSIGMESPSGPQDSKLLFTDADRPPPTSLDPNVSLDRAPRLRSVNTKRQARSKYDSPDAGEGTLSDEDGSKTRPAHNRAERNYRRRLNSSFEKLLDVMYVVAPDDAASRKGKEASRELSKGDVLRMARRQLITLEMENRRLRMELKQSRIQSPRAFSWAGPELAC